MKKTIRCVCGVDTWYESETQSVTYVDAWRTLQSKCKCGDEELEVQNTTSTPTTYGRR